MPERPLTIAAYAAGASLAAATFVYVFGPTFFLDDDATNGSRSTRKQCVVGLSNPANDCFINSTLQALAGLPELRLYLIREMHWRKLDGEALYNDLSVTLEDGGSQKEHRVGIPEWKRIGLQRGVITAALKDILDALNERPIYRKTISARAFISAVEQAFKTRLSRQQQDAQEFLQIVTERLADEHRAAELVRKNARQKLDAESLDVVSNNAKVAKLPGDLETIQDGPEAPCEDDAPQNGRDEPSKEKSAIEDNPSGNDATAEERLTTKCGRDNSEENKFPFEGKIESQIECSHCHFKPKPAISSFVTLTLNVPNASSTSLDNCFDGMLKIEHIDDFRCDRCMLEHAIQVNAKRLSRTDISTIDRQILESQQEKLRKAFNEDSENLPEGLKLPDISAAPKRRISRHMRISTHPKLLAIHLSRSVWDGYSTSTKNMAKVSFPETLLLGSILDRKTYRLLSVVTHKGGHHSGHYETFRRQWLSRPYSTPANMGREGIYSLHGSPAASPRLEATGVEAGERKIGDGSPNLSGLGSSTPPIPTRTASPAPSSRSSQRFSLDRRRLPFSTPAEERLSTSSIDPRPEILSQDDTLTPVQSADKQRKSLVLPRPVSKSKKHKVQDRWWRISDDRVRESKTSEVLGMQKEVYLLFYELVVE